MGYKREKMNSFSNYYYYLFVYFYICFDLKYKIYLIFKRLKFVYILLLTLYNMCLKNETEKIEIETSYKRDENEYRRAE